jgi:hypothetical protein
MEEPAAGQPSKPDDFTFVVFRPASPRQRARALTRPAADRIRATG